MCTQINIQYTEILSTWNPVFWNLIERHFWTLYSWCFRRDPNIKIFHSLICFQYFFFWSLAWMNALCGFLCKTCSHARFRGLQFVRELGRAGRKNRFTSFTNCYWNVSLLISLQHYNYCAALQQKTNLTYFAGGSPNKLQPFLPQLFFLGKNTSLNVFCHLEELLMVSFYWQRRSALSWLQTQHSLPWVVSHIGWGHKMTHICDNEETVLFTFPVYVLFAPSGGNEGWRTFICAACICNLDWPIIFQKKEEELHNYFSVLDL